MSTRGVIARVMGDGWEGVYNHNDSGPEWLGRELWRELQDVCDGDINMLLVNAIDLHPGGWSSYPNRCYCHTPGRNASRMILTDRTADPLFIEWVYAFSARARLMTVFYNTAVKRIATGQTAHYVEGRTYGRHTGYPSHYYVLRPFQVYPVDGHEPDWPWIKATVDAIRRRDVAAWDPDYRPNPFFFASRRIAR